MRQLQIIKTKFSKVSIWKCIEMRFILAFLEHVIEENLADFQSTCRLRAIRVRNKMKAAVNILKRDLLIADLWRIIFSPPVRSSADCNLVRGSSLLNGIPAFGCRHFRHATLAAQRQDHGPPAFGISRRPSHGHPDSGWGDHQVEATAERYLRQAHEAAVVADREQHGERQVHVAAGGSGVRTGKQKLNWQPTL